MQINVLEYLENSVRKNSDCIAIVESQVTTTFLELSKKSQAFAIHLNELIKTTRRPIAVWLPRSTDAIIADLGILYSGNFYTNIDDNSPSERLFDLLKNIQPVCLVTSTKNKLQVQEISDLVENVVLIDEFEFKELSGQQNELLQSIRSAHIDTDPMCLVNTSGSTGVPKSVVINHRSVIDYIDWWTEEFDFDQTDRFGSVTPFHFDHYTADLFVALKTAASIYLIPNELTAFPVSIVNFIKEHDITFVFWVPTLLTNIANLQILDSVDLPCLRRVFFAGEVFSTRHLNMWRKALPHVQFVNLYGPTEITVDCTFFVVDREFADNMPIPIGKPCKNSNVLILTEDNQLASIGEIGELCVRGSSLAMGYFNNPDQTAKSFTQNPLNSSYPELIYRTGDLVHVNAAGEIMFDGRKDFQIKHQGYRIELAEIENAVLALIQIKNACVLYNSEKKEIVLIYEANQELSKKEMRTLLSSKLPKYMLPTQFVHLDEIPRTPNDKIDRKFLATQYAT